MVDKTDISVDIKNALNLKYTSSGNKTITNFIEVPFLAFLFSSHKELSQSDAFSVRWYEET